MNNALKVTSGNDRRPRRPAKLFVIGVMCAASSLAAAMACRAATYHDLSMNVQPCSDCHTQHYSARGAKPVQTPGSLPVSVGQAGPYPRLLVQATTNALCLFCHDGSVPQAPNVLDPVTQYEGSGDEHSGAGFFKNVGSANANGHDLGINITNPKSDGSTFFSSLNNVTLSCASCHDPHGTTNYRSLVTAPAGGTGVTVEVSPPGTPKDVFRDQPAPDPPSSAWVNAYKRSNVGYRSNTSKWCTECHDVLKDHVGSTPPADRKHHRVDVAINGSGFPTDPNHWFDPITYPGAGFGTATGDITEGVPRLTFQVSGATDYASSKAVSAGNQVACTTCHLAHGGKYKAGLVWPNLDNFPPPSDADTSSGCAQCHNDQIPQ